jgi:hypothetical protein
MIHTLLSYLVIGFSQCLCGFDSTLQFLYARCMNVTVFTSHSADCPKKFDRHWKGCKCSSWSPVSEDRGFTRQSAKTRPWEESERRVKDHGAATA